MRRFLPLPLVLLPLLLAGCSAGFQNASSAALDTQSTAISGKAMGGQQPVANAAVTVYEAGTSGYGTGATAKATVNTDANGNFTFPANAYTCTASNAPMYLTATGGDPGGGPNANLALMATLGPCSAAKSARLIVNEVTTAATVIALGQFMGSALGASGTANIIGGTCSGCPAGTYNRGLLHAMNYTYPQLVSNALGTAVDSHSAGSVTVTTEAAKVTTIANVIAACINSQGQLNATETTTTCGKFFTGVNATSASPRASDTVQAALQMMRYPYYNVSTVFNLASPTPPFGGGLTTAPNDWTVAISYRTSSFGLGIAQNTTSNLDIDATGNIWVPSNKTGATGLVQFDPNAIQFNGPYGIANFVYPQYVALDQYTPSVAYTTDLGSNAVVGVITTAPTAIVQFSGPDSNYATGGPLALDASNNILIAGNGVGHSLYAIKANRASLVQAKDDFNDTFAPSASPNAVAVPLSVPFTNGYLYVGDTTSACNLEFSPGAQQGQGDKYSTGTSTCVVGGMVAAVANNAYITASTNTVCFYVPFQTSFNRCSSFASLNVPKGIALDGANRFWIANAGNASVAPLSVNTSNYTTAAIGSGYVHDTNNGNTLTTPYGLAIDGSGNVWVSNAACVATSAARCNPGSLTLTEIIGVAAPSITPLSYQEIGSSPLSGTKPTN